MAVPFTGGDQHRRNDSDATAALQRGLGVGIEADITSAQTEKECSHSRLLSRGAESSSFRGRKVSASGSSSRESSSFRRESSSSFRRESSSSFRRETVSSSFRNGVVSGSRRRESRDRKSLQEEEVSSVASGSARGFSTGSGRYNHQAALSGSNCPGSISAPHGAPWASYPSSPDAGLGESFVPFQWDEGPGKARTIAAAAEMALARKLVRDESLRKLNSASPRSSVDSRGSFRLEKKSSSAGSRRSVPPEPLLQQQDLSSIAALPRPPARRAASQEAAAPMRKESHSSQLIEDLKAAVVRKQAEEFLVTSKTKSEVVADDDTKSVISDYCADEAQIDLIAPAAAKFLKREDDAPILTPVKVPLAAVPFKWEEAPGKPKESVDCTAPHADPPSLTLPPRLLTGYCNPSKEQQAKILQTYSCNLMEMNWTPSGNPTPLCRSRDATPTRRERTPTRRDRTPTKRDLTPGRRDAAPIRRDTTPSRVFFPARAGPKSGPVSLPAVVALESVRDHHSGPLRSNTHPNYLNVSNRSVSQEFARVAQDSALTVLSQDLERSNRTLSDTGSGPLYSHRSSLKVSQELQIVLRDSSLDVSTNRSSVPSAEPSVDSAQECKAIVKAGSGVDPVSPTSILCGPDVDSSQRTVSNLSSAYAESSHSHLQETISEHTKSESCTSLESFVDESYNLPPPWSGSEATDSPCRDLGPVDLSSEMSQGNKSIEDGVRAVVKFCRRAKTWNKPKIIVRRSATPEPDMWAPTLATYFQKIELGSSILSKVGSQVFPEVKEAKAVHNSGMGGLAGLTSVPCSPLRFIPRSGDLTATPDRLGARKPLGSMTPVHVITTCRSPSYRVMATDECLSVLCIGKIWSGTKARQARWGRKVRKSSRLMGAVFAALKRSMILKCGRQSLSSIPSDKNLLDSDGEKLSNDKIARPQRDSIHSLSADHQFHRPL